MKNFKKLALAIGVTFLLSNNSPAAAVTLDFENAYLQTIKDPITNVVIGTNLVEASDHTQNYGGFVWQNTGLVNSSTYPLLSGYQIANTTPSGKMAAYNQQAKVSSTSSTSFNFFGASFTSGWNDNLQLLVEGISAGKVGYSRLLTLQPTSNLKINDFNFIGIDEVRFTSYGGTLHDGFDDSAAGDHFAMDEFNYSPVPEPSSLVLGMMGLGSLFGLRRNKKSLVA